MFETVLLSQKDIESVLTMKDVVEAVDKTFKGFGEGTTINPTKVGLDLGETAPYPPYEGFMNAMPAYVGWLDSAGIKWAGGFLGERKKMGLPYITSLTLLIDPKIGNFRAVMDGALITNWRTGAQTAVALKYLTNKKALNIGLYGAGMQGHTQIMAISELFEIENLTVYDLSPEALVSYKKEMAGYVTNEIKLAKHPQEASEGDAVICVTQSKDKFVKNEWIRTGTALFPMGSYQECDDEFILTADRIIVDHIGQCLHRGALKELSEAGKITESSLYATIGELAAGKKASPDLEKERVLCIPIGTGAMDVAVATIALEKAKEKGLGSKFSFV
ncbi:MAG: ornithine cyclodeaminase family protein [Synergistales bacterium]|nr:ornithine cyclodeaminase family protein [Synergistales bacterium]